MSDFSFSATAECHLCGSYLSASDEECDHDGQPVSVQIFREVGQGRDSFVGVECTVRYKWEKLREKVGDSWIRYQWLGPRSSVERMIQSGTWDSAKEIPMIEMSATADIDTED